MDLAALESDYEQRVKELSDVCSAKGFPDQDDLKNDKKLLHFYTGVSSFTILVAVFGFSCPLD